MLTEPQHPTRTEQAEITARTCRAERTRRARRLCELRRAGEDARELLAQTRAEFARDLRPNPDRARECRRESQRAADRYGAILADYDNSLVSDLLLDFAAEDTDVWGILSLKARY